MCDQLLTPAPLTCVDKDSSQYGAPSEDGTEWVEAEPPDWLTDAQEAIMWKGRQKQA